MAPDWILIAAAPSTVPTMLSAWSTFRKKEPPVLAKSPSSSIRFPPASQAPPSVAPVNLPATMTPPVWEIPPFWARRSTV